ncbi:hypothetical protein Tsubulata_032663 [Turnera subulata]|uniref:non-specific serine/threonine protein kinase n=1 Tax=Turnera subulata TaxID=218843 RepID=A0A9Q0J7Q6_9ROSI|nr:hypothetical protein Tsubulata_032663 [Turnera subulata]
MRASMGLCDSVTNISFLCLSSANPAFCLQNTLDQDPFHILSSWNDSVHYCAWPGVSCGCRHPQRVVALMLHSQGLVGSLSPHIGNLPFLRYVNLQNNSLHGHIPHELGIPTNLSGCRNIGVLNLIDNKMMGSIPVELGSLIKLTALGLARNCFTCTISASLGNYHLCLYNISSIEAINVKNNQLNGSIPSDVGLTLPRLQYLGLYNNSFTGLIQPTLSNASRFKTISFGSNYFTGPMPKDLGRLPQLHEFVFAQNQLEDDVSFINSLTNCSHLFSIIIEENFFTGQIPKFIAILSAHFRAIDFGENLLHGPIPIEIEYLTEDIKTSQVKKRYHVVSSFVLKSLTNMWFRALSITVHRSGPIHHINFTRFQQLQQLGVDGNKLSGGIPSTFGNLGMLSFLAMGFNNYGGEIPPSLGRCRSLVALDLSRNNLGGTVPKELLSLGSLSIALELSFNRLTGLLPPEIGRLRNLGILDVSGNKLIGIIPNSIAGCISMEELYIGGNYFAGEIPQAFSSLDGLKFLDISRKNLSGQIPEFLSKPSGLTLLNLSMNRLQGELPKQVIFLNASAVSLFGNKDLCGGISQLRLPPCLNSKKKKSNPHLIWKISIPSSLISYAEILRATNEFSTANVIGLGSYGSVYKGTLTDREGAMVAVKVLNLQQRGASCSFMSECRALGSIRHRNLLKLMNACSSVDFKGNDFKALIYEFMVNGSLEKWLHRGAASTSTEPPGETRNPGLNFIQRLNIAIDIATAVEYLHNGSPSTILHGDLKPNNVLLDDDMVARVGDFGLAKIVSTISSGDSSSLAIKGSIGYVAPEYGMGGKISKEGDVYSYGIILLEMFTGKRHTDPRFNDGLHLHTFVQRALPHQVMEIVDQDILYERRNHAYAECLLSVLTIGIQCSMTHPEDRMKIKDILSELLNIKCSHGK